MPLNQSESNDMGAEVENVRVVVRVRPMDKTDLANNIMSVVRMDKINRAITVIKPNCKTNEPPKTYYFDNVFGGDSSQLDLYVDTARPIVEKVLEGYNGTILAYGQTGTGKTYTMSGSADSPQTKGIIPNAFAHIFGHIAKAHKNQKFLVRVSYMEIYNEEVRDLLGKDFRKSLQVMERPDIGVFVKDLSGYVVHNANDMENILRMGNKNRAVSATKMNEESSRSHAIFSITVESSELHEGGKRHVRMGKLQLVDLAGSERQSKTQASGQHLKEATKINLSLFVLGNVISALVDGKSTHIPYRNSKLTRLLQDSLGGNSKTVMCATIGPSELNYLETICTLRYASHSKNIQNIMHINEDALLSPFQEEIASLHEQLEERNISEKIALADEEDVDDDNDDDEDADEDDDDEDEAALLQNVPQELVLQMNHAGRKEREKSDADKEALEKRMHEHQREIERAKSEQEQLRSKLMSLKGKILVGGENLLEKAQTQEMLLEQSLAELEERERAEQALRETLQQKETERIDIEEPNSTLQEASAGITKKIYSVMPLLMGTKSELADQVHEQFSIDRQKKRCRHAFCALTCFIVGCYHMFFHLINGVIRHISAKKFTWR